jgi:MFS transporter, FHS family, glucose/mannose:H+ symporter
MRFSRLTYSLAGVFLCYGAMVFAFGPCLTSMADAFGVSVGRLGLIFSLYAVGLTPSVLLNGYLSEITGRRPLLLGILLILAVACGMLGLVAARGGEHGFAWLLVAMVLLGYGGGGVEALTNILVTDDNQPAPTFALNVTHAFFAIGAVLSPLAVSLLLRGHLPWHFVFYGCGAVFFALFFVLLPQRMPAGTEGPFAPGEAVALLRLPLIWVLLALITFYVGAEMGVSAWVSPLLEKVLRTRRDLAGLSVSVFWTLMIVGRLLVGPIAVRLRPPPVLLVLALGSAVSTLVIAFAGSAAVCLAATGAAGLFMSGIFALVLVDASRHFPERLGAVFGTIMTGVGFGSLIFPVVMGTVAEGPGLRVAMLIPVGLMIVVAGAYVVRWRE